MRNARPRLLPLVILGAFAGAAFAEGAGQVITGESAISITTALTVAGAAFGGWAVVIGYVLAMVRKDVTDLRLVVREYADDSKDREEKAHGDRLHIERRITELESAIRRNAQH